jgi:hypothetical protein
MPPPLPADGILNTRTSIKITGPLRVIDMTDQCPVWARR